MAQAFTASFQEVQWIVLAYLLAITTLIKLANFAKYSDRSRHPAADGCSWPESSCSRWLRSRADSRPHAGKTS